MITVTSLVLGFMAEFGFQVVLLMIQDGVKNTRHRIQIK